MGGREPLELLAMRSASWTLALKSGTLPPAFADFVEVERYHILSDINRRFEAMATPLLAEEVAGKASTIARHSERQLHLEEAFDFVNKQIMGPWFVGVMREKILAFLDPKTTLAMAPIPRLYGKTFAAEIANHELIRISARTWREEIAKRLFFGGSRQESVKIREVPGGSWPPPYDAKAMMSCSELADKFGVGPAALKKRLARWRRENDYGWKEVDFARNNEARILYEVGAVFGLIAEMHGK